MDEGTSWEPQDSFNKIKKLPGETVAETVILGWLQDPVLLSDLPGRSVYWIFLPDDVASFAQRILDLEVWPMHQPTSVQQVGFILQCEMGQRISQPQRWICWCICVTAGAHLLQRPSSSFLGSSE